MTDRWISLARLVDETGISARLLRYVREQEPGVLVTRERRNRTRTKTEYKQPACAVNLRRRECERARQQSRGGPRALRDAELRQALAGAELAELQLATLRSQVVPIEESRYELRRILDRIRARVMAIPSVHAAHMLGVEDLGEAVRRLRAVAAGVLQALPPAGREEGT